MPLGDVRLNPELETQTPETPNRKPKNAQALFSAFILIPSTFFPLPKPPDFKYSHINYHILIGRILHIGKVGVNIRGRGVIKLRHLSRLHIWKGGVVQLLRWKGPQRRLGTAGLGGLNLDTRVYSLGLGFSVADWLELTQSKQCPHKKSGGPDSLVSLPACRRPGYSRRPQSIALTQQFRVRSMSMLPNKGFYMPWPARIPPTTPFPVVQKKWDWMLLLQYTKP